MTDAGTTRANSRGRAGPASPTIAFVTNMATNYRMSQSLLSGIACQAREENVNLICLPGNTSPLVISFRLHLSSIANLLNRDTVSGLVVWGSGILGSTVTDNLRFFFDYFRGFPTVNVGLLWEGVPNVIVDNYRGMTDAVRHLIERHGCRRIAFIRGPERHEEAELRFKAYADALRAHGLPLDPALVAVGTFQKESGAAAIAELLDRRRVPFDALVASSDWMAFGAYEELSSRGIRVPEDVKLAGFDDIEDCQNLTTPFTTVKQPFFEMGKTAVKNVLSLIGGGRPGNAILPSELIVRESCGCENPLLRDDEIFLPERASARAVADRDGLRREAAADMERRLERFPIDRAAAGEIVGRLAGALFDELVGGEPGFLSALARETDRIATGDQYAFFHSVVSALRRVSFPLWNADPARRKEAESLWQRSRILLSELAFRSSFTDRTRHIVRSQRLQDVTLLLITTLNLSDFMDLFARQLPRLGVTSCFLSLYDDPGSCRWSRLMLAYVDGKRLDLDPAGVRFRTTDLAPAGFLPENRRTLLSIQPLYSGEEQLGFFMSEEGPRELKLNELMCAQLSMAIRGSLLFKEKRQLLADLERRARELAAASEELARSNAELEQFALIASHDLQEPLRKISIFSERLNMDFERISANERHEFLDRIQASCLHMRKLIQDLLSYARLSNLPPAFRPLDLTPLVREVLTELDARIEHERAEVRLDELPALEGEATPLRQLFQNLISNALKFHRPGVPPAVSISGRRVLDNGRECAEITVADNGIGIDRKHLERIFVVFQRLHGPKDFEGTGIGLAVCRRVVDRHEGTIRVESAPGAGSRFIITLPLEH